MGRLMEALETLWTSFTARDIKNVSLRSWEDKASYAVGVDMARSIKRTGMGIKPAEFARGMWDELSGAKLLMAEMDIRTTFSAFQAEYKRKRAQDGIRSAASAGKDRNAEFTIGAARTAETGTLPGGMKFKAYRDNEAGKSARRGTGGSASTPNAGKTPVLILKPTRSGEGAGRPAG